MIDPTPDPAAVQRILEARARALARPLDSETPDDTVELVVLTLGAERYAVSIHHVQAIQVLAGLTPVPGLPPFWAGLINSHGRLYPVLNLRRYLDLPQAAPAEGSRIVLASAAGLSIGLLADDVPEVQRVPQAAIGPPLGEVHGLRRETIAGVTPDLLTVLDLDRLLADPALAIDEQVV